MPMRIGPYGGENGSATNEGAGWQVDGNAAGGYAKNSGRGTAGVGRKFPFDGMARTSIHEGTIQDDAVESAVLDHNFVTHF